MALGACVFLATTKAMSGSRMPTKTTSPSLISRAAATTMSSLSVYRAVGALVDITGDFRRRKWTISNDRRFRNGFGLFRIQNRIALNVAPGKNNANVFLQYDVSSLRKRGVGPGSLTPLGCGGAIRYPAARRRGPTHEAVTTHCTIDTCHQPERQ